ncbi:hypothetical protein [Congregibacter sp.]|uniref:hypothetical protein n=1 Tax=Congregibacter sp. TaxID=2744308 RepID=UPI003F6B4ECD
MTEQFQALAQGNDAPPGPRFRLEGLMEAAVITGDADEGTLRALVAELHESIMGDTIEALLGENWARWHPFPQIPAFSHRAPVSPSTSD